MPVDDTLWALPSRRPSHTAFSLVYTRDEATGLIHIAHTVAGVLLLLFNGLMGLKAGMDNYPLPVQAEVGGEERRGSLGRRPTAHCAQPTASR